MKIRGRKELAALLTSITWFQRAPNCSTFARFSSLLSLPNYKCHCEYGHAYPKWYRTQFVNHSAAISLTLRIFVIYFSHATSWKTFRTWSCTQFQKFGQVERNTSSCCCYLLTGIKKLCLAQYLSVYEQKANTCRSN